MRFILFSFFLASIHAQLQGACTVGWDALRLSSSYQSVQSSSSCAQVISVHGVKGSETISATSESAICLAKSDTARIFIASEGISSDAVSFRWEQEFSSSADATLTINDSLVYHLLSDGMQDQTQVFQQVFEPSLIIHSLEIRQSSASSGQISIGAIAFGTSPDAEEPIYSYGDVVVSELMVDPVPAVYLADCEYIELANTRSDTLQLGSLSLYVNETKISLPSYTLAPGKCAVVHGGCFPMQEGFFDLDLPALPNTSCSISIVAGTQLLYAMHYDANEYEGSVKSNGGWSLEKQDLASRSNFDYAFTADRRGGSPGQCTAAKISKCPVPTIDVAEVFGGHYLYASFSHQIDSTAVHLAQIQLDGSSADSISWDAPLYRSARLFFSVELMPKTLYELHIESLTSMCGTVNESAIAQCAVTEIPELGDIIFNEVQYDPAAGTSEYIELRNISDKAVSLADLQLVTYDGDTIQEAAYPLSTGAGVLLPGAELLIAADTANIADAYQCVCPENFHEMGNFPALTNTGRSIGLYNKSLELIDQLDYSPAMHSARLADAKGVSLQRTAAGWSSSPASCGYGSPGCANSDLETAPSISSLCSDFFSPNGDGIDDMLTISFDAEPNSTADVIVFSESGQLINHLADKILCAGTTSVLWKGDLPRGFSAPAGIYIVWVCIWDDGGKKVLKQPSVLVR